MSVTLGEEAMNKTRGRRESYLAGGTVITVVGLIILLFGACGLSCSFGLYSSCEYSVSSFVMGVIGGVSLGFGVMILLVGFALGRYVYVTR